MQHVSHGNHMGAFVGIAERAPSLNSLNSIIKRGFGCGRKPSPSMHHIRELLQTYCVFEVSASTSSPENFKLCAETPGNPRKPSGTPRGNPRGNPRTPRGKPRGNPAHTPQSPLGDVAQAPRTLPRRNGRRQWRAMEATTTHMKWLATKVSACTPHCALQNSLPCLRAS